MLWIGFIGFWNQSQNCGNPGESIHLNIYGSHPRYRQYVRDVGLKISSINESEIVLGQTLNPIIIIIIIIIIFYNFLAITDCNRIFSAYK
jgi:hypothetical protein